MKLTPETEIIDVLDKENVDTVVTLPCEKMKNLFELVSQSSLFRHIPINREEEGIGICAGTHLAGGKPLMLIQSSGLGNSINAIMSLTKTYEFPLPTLASWRGIYKERIPAHIPFGRALPKVLEALNIPYKIIHDASETELVRAVVLEAYQHNTVCVGLIIPRTFESSEIMKQQHFPKRQHKSFLEHKELTLNPRMTRHQAIRVVSKCLDEEIVISNIGVPSKELYAVRDRELNFYMLGSLGQASAIGLGVSLKTRKETIVLDGDGSLLTNPSVLSTVATQKPGNLTIFCLDNGTWGSTGDQMTNAYTLVDMELVAKSMGIEKTRKVQSEKELRHALESIKEKEAPMFVHVMVKPGNANVNNIPMSPVEIKQRFMKALRE